MRPFLLVCESKNPRLIGIVLGSIQKLLAHNAVSDEGRAQIIQALQQVRSSCKYHSCGMSRASLAMKQQCTTIDASIGQLNNARQTQQLLRCGEVASLQMGMPVIVMICYGVCLPHPGCAVVLRNLGHIPTNETNTRSQSTARDMLQVEKSSDDTVKLKILQTALTLLQNPHNVDDKVLLHHLST